MNIPRFYQDLDQYLQPNRATVIFGPRQAGKTTLLTKFLEKSSYKYRLVSGDDVSVQEVMGSQSVEQLRRYVWGYDVLAIDEAQRIPGVGMGLKILVDHVPGIKVIATGSSSFELSGQVGEPLVGRKISLNLYPVAQLELRRQLSVFDLQKQIPHALVFGGFPAVLTAPLEKRPAILSDIINSYLLKDILELEKVKGAKTLLDLLRLVAFQVGSEVSLSELAQQVGLDYKTVARYLDLFEKSFVLVNLRGFSRNMRQAVTRKSKYYFIDNGIRNAVISNFNSLEIRDDVGKLWENFLVIERLKFQHYEGILSNNYFWRNWSRQEIDWIEEREGKIFAFEFKYSVQNHRLPREFSIIYPDTEYKQISKENYLDFVAGA